MHRSNIPLCFQFLRYDDFFSSLNKLGVSLNYSGFVKMCIVACETRETGDVELVIMQWNQMKTHLTVHLVV